MLQIHFSSLSFNFIIYFFMYVCITVLGLCCCTQAFPSCGKWGLLFVAVCGLLIAVACLCCGARALGVWASVVVALGLSSCGSQALQCRLSSCGTQTQLLRGLWDLPGPGIEPMSPALAGGFLTTAPPCLLISCYFNLHKYFFLRSTNLFFCDFFCDFFSILIRFFSSNFMVSFFLLLTPSRNFLV